MSAAASRYTLLLSVVVVASMLIAAMAGGSTMGRDRQSPSAPTNLRVSSANTTTVTVTWDPSVDNVGVTGYDVTYYNAEVDGVRTRTWATTFTVQGLACGTSVTVDIRAVDLARNRSASTTATVSTSACPDTEPPSVPTGFRQVATTQDAVVLAWSPSTDNTGVASYGVYRDLTTRVAAPSEPTVTLNGLSCDRTYTYQVDAADAAGNRSLFGTARVQTAACSPAPSPNPPPAPSEWTFCAWEGSDCAFDGRKDVRYGENGVFTSPRQFDSRIACTNAVFGDPLVGTRKKCQYRDPQPTSPPPPPSSDETVNLSDLGWASATSGWGPVEKNQSNGERDADDGRRLTLDGVAYDKGLGVHAPSDIRYTLDENCKRFKATVGIDDEVGDRGSAVFEIYADGDRVFSTDEMTGATARAGIDVSIAGAKELGLVVTNAGDDIDYDHADWADARIECGGSQLPTPPAPAPPPPGDTTPPSSPGQLGVTDATTTSVSLGWNAANDNVVVQGYGVYMNGNSVTTTPQLRATVAQLACGSAATFEVDAFDAAGNRSVPSSVTASTRACTDNQAPSPPTNLYASSRTATSIALNWSSATDNTGVAGYTLYVNGAAVGTSTTTSWIFSNLTCNSNHTLAVDAYDGAGNHSARTTVLVATTACPDTTPPSAPTGLTVSGITQTSLNLAWNASTDSGGIAGYDVYQNGAKQTTVTTTTWGQTGLACGTTFTLGVVAVDRSANRSPQSQTTATTAACSSPTQWTTCATEGQQCSFSGARDVRYGANGTFTTPRTFSDGVLCSNGVFGDPVPGVTKHCETSAATGTPSPSPAPSPQPPPPAGGAPATITQGGTYSATWVGNGSGPAVRIATSQPVVIQNSVIRNSGGANLIDASYPGANLTVRNTTLEGQAGGTGKAVFANGFRSIRVEACTIVRTWGIRLDRIESGGSVVVTRNKVRNIVRAGDLTHFYQAANWSVTPAAHEISWNEVIGEFGQTGVEDVINIYDAGHARIHDNYIEGAYPSSASGGFSGSGIMLDSGAHDNEVWGNVIVETTNAGIGIASGWNNKVHDNKIVFDGRLEDGTGLSASNVGLYVWNYDGNSSWRGNEAWANDIGWRKADGSRNDWWLPNCSGACSNASLPNPVDGNTEQAAYQEWLSRLSANGLSVGI